MQETAAMNSPNNATLTAAEWSKQYVQEWLREGETELWAGQSKRLKGKPVITVVHCAGFDGEPPCIEVRIGKRLHTSTMATRNWQNERRVAVRVGMELAGKSGNAAEIDAALDAVKARQPSVTQQVAELARLIADRLAEENGSWELAECIDMAKTIAWTLSSQGPQAHRAALDAEWMGKNGREMDHEADARETVAIYSRF